MSTVLVRPLGIRVSFCLLWLSTVTGVAAQGATPASTDAAAAQQAAAPSVPASRPPAINRVNERLPAWLRVRGEFRERMEGVDGAGFDSARQDLYWLSRLRFDATVMPSAEFRVHVQAQDARVARKTLGPTGPPFRAPIDLRLAYADIGASPRPVTLRVGRQELAYGEQRLVGHVSWVNAARSFDGATATFRGKSFAIDAFATSIVRVLEDDFDRSGNGNRFFGTYGRIGALLPKGSLEPYLFWRRDRDLATESGPRGDLAQATLGLRLAGSLPARYEYDVELALQRGSLGSDDVQAWAGHWRLRKGLEGRGAVRLIGEYNFASGDEDPTDAVRGTFDQLYPTGHDKYGLADQVGWRNILHLRTGFELTPIRKLPIAANYHTWWLAEPRDGLYTAGGAPIARVPAGAASRHVGQELDVQVSRAVTPQVQLLAGYAHVFTGRFLEEATPGASYSHPFVMVTYVFLAEK